LRTKAKITAQRSSVQEKQPIRSQNHSRGDYLSQTTGNNNTIPVPRGDAQTSYPVPSFIYTAGRAQQESTLIGQSATSLGIVDARSQTVGSRPDSQIGAENIFQSPTPPAPNQSESLKFRRTDRKLYAQPHRPSNRTAFDKDFIWQLEHPRIFVYSKTYREHPPLGRIKGSSLLQDPRFNYLHNSYHETERLLRSFESRTTW
jgi:hypothetical protein